MSIITFAINGANITINNSTVVTMPHNIAKCLNLGDKLFILYISGYTADKNGNTLTWNIYGPNTSRNIIALDSKGKQIWQVAKRKASNKYSSISLNNNTLVATLFDGAICYLDPDNGAIIKEEYFR